MGRFFRLRFLALPIAVVSLASCAAQNANHDAFCNVVFLYPLVKMVYPIDGTGGVAPRGGIIVYASWSNGQPGPLRVPIAIQNDARTQAQIQTTPTAVPSPLPSPAATPSGGTSELFAVAVPPLVANEKYDVLATIHAGGCVPTPRSFQDTVGSFRTR